tara:strand:+ start:198 stop:818 length:621 start_codon:yes stop_codon:yes gene_type:complete
VSDKKYMTNRKKRLKLIQFSLFLLGIIIIFFTYRENNSKVKKVVSAETQIKVKDQLSNNVNTGDIFYNIQFSGFDISGNRYILKSAEAYNDKFNQEIVNMKSVNAVFYFKDGNYLNVSSKKGRYNNKTLDMTFEDDIEAKYNESTLNANIAEYSNSLGFLTISEKVKLKDSRGTMFADRLLFDIKNQTLNIASFDNKKVNAEINIK